MKPLQDIWNFQLQNVGVKIEDFDKKGFVTLIDDAIWWDREKGIQFKTPVREIRIFQFSHGECRFPIICAVYSRAGAVGRVICA